MSRLEKIMPNISKKIIKKGLSLFGLQITKKIIHCAEVSHDAMEAGLLRVSKHFTSATVVDIGAAAGTWTVKCLPVWKNANYVLFEPLEERAFEINALKLANPQTKISHVKAAAGKERGKISFTVTDDLDGSGIYGSGDLREVNLYSIDEELFNSKNKAPYLLKLDTHGFEIPIFEGATEVLKRTELIIVEVYRFFVAPDSLLFWQICRYLDGKGFRLFDMVDTMRRPGDQVFW